jgi:Flp pilus assembly pilin Flp
MFWLTRRRIEPVATSHPEEKNMLSLICRMASLRIWRDRRGQDLIEYALMAGFVAVAAGAIMPGVASSISTIFSQVSSVLSSAATTS